MSIKLFIERLIIANVLFLCLFSGINKNNLNNSNQDSLVNNDTAIKTEIRYSQNDTLNEYYKDYNSLFLEKNPLKLICNYKLFINKYNNINSNQIKNELNYLPTSLKFYFASIDSVGFNLLNISLNDSVNDRPFIYFGLLFYNMKNGNPEQALIYDSLLHKECPEHYLTNLLQDYERNLLIKAKHEIDNIKSKKLSEDEYLWLYGKIYKNMFRNSLNVAEVGWNLSFPFSFFNQLIKKFPKSKFADNAEYEMLSYNEAMSHEGGSNSYNLIAIEDYKKFLDKYPETELKPEILIRISELYLYAGFSFKENINYIQMSIENLNKLLAQYPNLHNLKRLKNLKNEIDNSLWDFDISSDKLEYKISEPVYITFTIKNISKRSKSINLYKDKSIPNFPLYIQHYDCVKILDCTNAHLADFINSNNKYSESTYDIIIKPNSTYIEKWNICDKAIFLNSNNSIGHYIFNKPGKYHISAYANLSTSNMGSVNVDIDIKIIK